MTVSMGKSYFRKNESVGLDDITQIPGEREFEVNGLLSGHAV